MTVLAVAQGVAAWDSGEVVYVAMLPRGPIRVLEVTAAVIWRAVPGSPRAEVADRVAATLGLDPVDIRRDVDEFIERLIVDRLID